MILMNDAYMQNRGKDSINIHAQEERQEKIRQPNEYPTSTSSFNVV